MTDSQKESVLTKQSEDFFKNASLNEIVDAIDNYKSYDSIERMYKNKSIDKAEYDRLMSEYDRNPLSVQEDALTNIRNAAIE